MSTELVLFSGISKEAKKVNKVASLPIIQINKDIVNLPWFNSILVCIFFYSMPCASLINCLRQWLVQSFYCAHFFLRQSKTKVHTQVQHCSCNTSLWSRKQICYQTDTDWTAGWLSAIMYEQQLINNNTRRYHIFMNLYGTCLIHFLTYSSRYFHLCKIS